MVRSSWPSERSTVNSQTPTAVPKMPPASSIEAECQIDRAPPPVGDRAGARRGGDVARDARHRHRRRDADEDQQRRHQEAAADTEHARDEPDRQAHGENQQDVDGQVGDRKIDLHAGGPAGAHEVKGKPSRHRNPRQLGRDWYRLDRADVHANVTRAAAERYSTAMPARVLRRRGLTVVAGRPIPAAGRHPQTGRRLGLPLGDESLHRELRRH